MVESSEQKLKRGTDRIQESIRVANETESIGAGILETLSGQRQTMLRARDNVRFSRSSFSHPIGGRDAVEVLPTFDTDSTGSSALTTSSEKWTRT